MLLSKCASFCWTQSLKVKVFVNILPFALDFCSIRQVVRYPERSVMLRSYMRGSTIPTVN